MAIWVSEAFRFCPGCGSANNDVGSNPLSCSDCGFAYYFSPTIAVGAIVGDESGRVLMLRRGRDPGKGLLGLPGGFVDPGETAEAACNREVMEETGLQVRSLEYLTSFPNEYTFLGVTRPVTDIFFVGRVDSFDDLKPQDGEVDSCTLLHPTEQELERMAFESNRLAVETFLAQRRSAAMHR